MSSIKTLTGLIVDSYREDGGANHIGGLHLPSRARVARLLTDIEELIFPGFACDDALTDETLEIVTGARVARLLEGVSAQVALDIAHERRLSRGRRGDVDGSDGTGTDGLGSVDPALAREARSFTVALLEHMPALRAALNLDVEALFAGDPAVRSREEIILAYPGLRAIVVHRVAHFFWQNGLRLLARMMSEAIHGATGIDIHPGATIGRSFYIDHGTGVVIGETTVIKDHVKIYQGVSLGALSVSKRLQDHRRHPTIEDHVTIYAGATILGGETVVGHHSVVGGNVWLVKSVAPYSVVEHDAVVRVASRSKNGSDFDPGI
jgi:serine O-acetyltransferase